MKEIKYHIGEYVYACLGGMIESGYIVGIEHYIEDDAFNELIHNESVKDDILNYKILISPTRVPLTIKSDRVYGSIDDALSAL